MPTYSNPITWMKGILSETSQYINGLQKYCSNEGKGATTLETN